MVVFPNAKINLGLNIISTRDDGYHNINTVFYPVPLYDVLEVTDLCSEITPGKNVVLHTIGMKDDGKQNIVEKAYCSMAERYAIPPVEVWLKKNIPVQAGLGGGSSDAAFMLLALKEKYKLPVSDEELHDIARGIGADCPFFLYNKPLMAFGIGSDFSPADISLGGLSILLIKPKVSISTAEAYSGIKPHKPETNLGEIVGMPVTQWRDVMVNDFETCIFNKYPELERIKSAMYENGAIYASMSGSGSALYGLFEKEIDTDRIMEECGNMTECCFWRVLQ